MALLSRDQFINNDKYAVTRLMYEAVYDPDAVLSMDGSGDRINLRELYLSCCVTDPTEYDLAMTLFGDFVAWERFVANKRVAPHIEQLRHEANVARKSQAFTRLVKDATSDDSKTSVTSAKYLIEEPWLKDGRTTDGRKQRAAQRKAANEAFHNSGIADDVQRLRDEGLIN